MSEKCSNGVNVNPFVQQLHGESVPEAMEGDMLADSCLAYPTTDMSYKNTFRNQGEVYYLIRRLQK
jgi:hypothetical protein